MNTSQLIGQRIQHYRKIKSLTQKDLATILGVKSPYIANIEQGHKGVSLDKLIEICRCLDIGLSDLLPIERQNNVAEKDRIIDEIISSFRDLDVTQLHFIKNVTEVVSVNRSVAGA